MTSSYAVSLLEFPAKLFSVEGVILDDHNDRNTIKIEAGMTLWIGERISAKHATFKILDYYNPDHKTQESSLFQCQLSQLQLVQDDLWPFVVAILDPQERLSFAKQQKRMLRAKQLEISKIVKVSGRPFGRTAEFFDCIIRYIGPVPEIGPGHYFGLELLNLIQGKSPQKDDLAFVSKYMKTEPELSLILAANWLDLDEYELPNNSKQTKKNFVNELFCGAKEKIKRNGKRLTDLKESYSYSREDIIGRSDTPDPVGPNRNSKTLPGIVPELEQNEVDLKDVLGKKWPAAAGKTASILNTENKTTQTQLPAGYAAAVTTNGSAIVPELDQNEVDLKDVLGKNWSAAARKTASILNTENKATQTRPPARYAIAVATNGSVEGGKFEQNKSPNPLSNSKPSTFSFKVELKIVQDAATMADLTNDSSLNPFDNGNGPAAISSPSSSGVEPVIQPSSLKELPDNPLLEVGSLVEVDVVYAKLYGVIRWIGPLHIPGTSSSNSRVVVGIELEDKPRMAAGVEITDGVYDNVRLFDCPMNHGIFVFPVQCNQDQRFQDVYVEPQL